jgi:soluble cytochrome b562
MVYVGYEEGGVHALNTSDGSKKWANTDISTVFASPAVADETVYVGSVDNNVYALDKADRSVRWRSQTGDTVQSSPAVVSDTVYVGSDDGNVYALDAGDGTERWRFETASAVGISSPAVVDGTVYVGNSDGVLYAISGETSTPTATPTATETADEPNEPPTASITVTTSEPAAGEPITFDASGSTDPDGSIAIYEWEISVSTGGGGGGTVDSTDPAVQEYIVPSDAESVEAELTVTDDDGATDTTTRRVEFDDSGSGVLRWLVGVGTLGAAGGGAWWYRRRGGTDTATGRGQSGGGSGSPPSQPSTATSATTSPSSRGDARSATDSGLLKSVDKLREEGGTHRDEASDYRAAGEYDRALSTYDKAQETYEEALDKASESDLIDSDEIEQELAAVERARQEVHRQRLQEKVESLRSDLDHADTLADEGDLENAKERLEDLDPHLTAAKRTATQRDLDNLQGEIAKLERRREERLTGIIKQHKTHPVPERIPRAPEVTVDFDALTNEEPIGGGGNADVSKATFPTPDGDVTLAIKRPRMSGTLHSDQVERMLNEAETWDKLDDHDHIVGVVDYGSEPLPWIGMEYMDGGHLGSRASQLTVPQSLWTAVAVTNAVRHAHRSGIAHLDLKPENVLFRSVKGAWDVPKVADWGLSKRLLTHSSSVEGFSPTYAAPEQFDDSFGSTDDLTDVYQLGAVFYELFTGRPPFEGKPAAVMRQVLEDTPEPPSRVASLPPQIDEIVLTALKTERSDRYDDILYLRDDLRAAYDEYFRSG